jgi:hypothetical protein
VTSRRCRGAMSTSRRSSFTRSSPPRARGARAAHRAACAPGARRS